MMYNKVEVVNAIYNFAVDKVYYLKTFFENIRFKIHGFWYSFFWKFKLYRMEIYTPIIKIVVLDKI